VRSPAALLLLAVCACGPERETVDEEAYTICEALYQAAVDCGRLDEVDDEMTKRCSENRNWQPPCRDLRKRQLECYPALTCEELDDELGEAVAECDALRYETGLCSIENFR
jgi:hypothetical protein